MRSITALLALVSILLSPAFASTAVASQSILDIVRDRGYVKCAIGNRPVGDTRIGATGYEGFFPEFCRVIALAIFGDRNAVQMSPTLIRHGLQSISEGEVDVYISNVTWTYSRDMTLQLTPAAVLYYDGQGFMSHKGTVQGELTKLEKAIVCVSRSTTTIGNLEDYIKLHNLSWRIEALATLRSTAVEDPDNYVLHDEVISKEPLVAYVSAKDMIWGNVVRWAIFATILAEEKGISSANYREHLASRDPAIRRLLGVEEIPGSNAAGMAPDWARQVIADAGNYGEIFERYLGKGSQMNIKRGANKLWKDGGLIYSPPFR
jgi:general L-amino acid transport system substrate-binding protein